jgi:predicted Rossmann fold flavoprotein
LLDDDGIARVVAGKREYRGRSYILATGGVSHPETGSTGDGFRWLYDLGHTVVAPTSSLVPIRVKEAWAHRLAGVTLPDVKIAFFCEGEKFAAKRGPVLFTHYGLSGPLILNAAETIGRALEQGAVTARINCVPNVEGGSVDRHLRGVFEAHKNRQLKNVLREVVPSSVVTAIGNLRPSLDLSLAVHSVTKEDRRAIAELLHALPLTITGLQGRDLSIVADGGVPLTEIDMRTMRSKRIPNLYVTGDLLHINRPSGGYSLQLCWTTGFVAGTHA